MTGLPAYCPVCGARTYHHCKRKCGWWKCGQCCSYGSADKINPDRRRRAGSDTDDHKETTD